jgi:ATP phosphoribosyltransferase
MTTLCVSNNIKMNMIFNKIINNYNSFQSNLINNLNEKTIKIGLCLPKTINYQEKIFDFLKLNGINIEIKNNKINLQFLNQTNNKIKSFLIKPKDVYRFIEKNLMDVVLCFQDILENFPCNYKKINCNYESNNKLITKICVIAQKNFNLEIYKKNKLKKLVIFSEYNYLTNKWVEENELTAKIVNVNGANEGHLICNLCDLIVCVSSTGETIKANNLQILEKIYVNNLGFYVKPELQEEIQNIINKEK